jgi:hypothetical protein
MRKGESNTRRVRAPEDLTACPRFRIFLISDGTSGMPAEGNDILALLKSSFSSDVFEELEVRHL